MADPATLWRRVVDYAAADDPLTGASNRLALVLAANQPFYPLYVRWMTGEANAGLALTLLSTPLFLAAPFVARRFPGAGRLWFPLVGALDSFFCALIFGADAGVEFFLAPSLLIAILSCRRTEALPLGVFVAATSGALALALAHGGYGAPLFPPSVAQLAGLRALNAWSAASLCVIAVWMIAPARFGTGGVRR